MFFLKNAQEGDGLAPPVIDPEDLFQTSIDDAFYDRDTLFHGPLSATSAPP
jgi:hypothetical protein